jgi:hypothetical protein
MPVMHMQLPLLHVWPVPHVTAAHGSVTLPAVPVAVPAVPAVPVALPVPAVALVPAIDAEPPVPTLIPPLDTEPVPAAVPEPLAPGCAAVPLVLPAPMPLVLPVPLPPVMVEGSSEPPELQATSHSSRTGDCFNQDLGRITESVASTPCGQARPVHFQNGAEKIEQGGFFQAARALRPVYGSRVKSHRQACRSLLYALSALEPASSKTSPSVTR